MTDPRRMDGSSSAPASSSGARVELAPGDPRVRLLRHVPGERRCLPRGIPERLVVREQWEDPIPPVPEYTRTVREGDVRPTRRQVDPGPNAPKLIRLVRTPFALETARMRVDPERGAPKRIRVADQVREPHGVDVRAAFAETAQRPAFPKPTAVHPPHPVRDRASASAWLADPTPPQLTAEERAALEGEDA